MASRNEQDVVAVAAFGEIETACAVSRRSDASLGSNRQPERRGERPTNVDDWVQLEDGF